MHFNGNKLVVHIDRLDSRKLYELLELGSKRRTKTRTEISKIHF